MLLDQRLVLAASAQILVIVGDCKLAWLACIVQISRNRRCTTGVKLDDTLSCCQHRLLEELCLVLQSRKLLLKLPLRVNAATFMHDHQTSRIVICLCRHLCTIGRGVLVNCSGSLSREESRWVALALQVKRVVHSRECVLGTCGPCTEIRRILVISLLLWFHLFRFRCTFGAKKHILSQGCLHWMTILVDNQNALQKKAWMEWLSFFNVLQCTLKKVKLEPCYYKVW